MAASAWAVNGAVHAQSAASTYAVSPWPGPIGAFNLTDTTGKSWTPDEFKGRAVLLNFWASWCEPCRAEMPSLQQLAQRMGPDRLLVLAINFKEPAARAIAFANTAGIELPVLLDLQGNAARAWGVKIFPTTLMIDSRGRPQHRVQGEVDWSQPAAQALVSGLLKA